MKTIRNLTAILFLQLLYNNITAQTLNWARHAGGDQNGSSDIVVNASGQLYSTGIFWNSAGPGILDFDPGPGVMNVAFNTAGSAYVTKRDTAGDLIWAKSFSGTGATWSKSIALDGQENIFVLGTFYGTTDFDPGTGVYNLSSNQKANFLCKLDTNGDFLWAIKLPNTMGWFTSNFAVDLSGNSFIGGVFSGICDFDPGPGTYTVNAQNQSSFILKLDPTGNFTWVKTMDIDELWFLTLDQLGNIYITGGYGGTVDFDPGTGITNLSAQGWDAFVAKYDNSGSLLWAKSVGGSGPDQAESMFVDAIGNSYIRGSFSVTADFDPGAAAYTMTAQSGKTDQFFLKLDAAGNFVWAKQLAIYDQFFLNLTRGISADAAGNVIITGLYSGTVDFDPGPGNFYMTYNSQPNIPPPYFDKTKFIVQLNSSGSFVWAYTLDDKALGSAVHDDLGAIYLAGAFQGSVDFDPGPGVYNLSGGTGTVSKLYFLKLDPVDISTALNQQTVERTFKIYPNPTNELITLKTRSQFNGRTYVVCDQSGRQLMTGSLKENETVVDLSSLSAGLYFISLADVARPVRVIKQ